MLEKRNDSLKELIEFLWERHLKTGKPPSKSSLAVMYNGTWRSLTEMIDIAKAKGIELNLKEATPHEQ